MGLSKAFLLHLSDESVETGFPDAGPGCMDFKGETRNSRSVASERGKNCLKNFDVDPCC